MKKLIIATHNKGKLAEFKEIFKDKFEVLSLPFNGYDGEAEETGSTFYENALLKAKDVFNHTGEMALADDSGLCVDSLNGEPGILSARFGGENLSQKQKNQLLISRLKPFENKKAHFECSLVLYGKNGIIATGKGRTEGVIIDEERGNNGFGYDGIFLSDVLNKTFAEATNSEKNQVSHRANAIKDLLNNLNNKGIKD